MNVVTPILENDIIFNIDYHKEYFIIVLTEIRDDIKIRLRDNKLNTILRY